MERLIRVTKDTDSFRFDADTYHKDYKIQCYLEKLFDSFYQAVWVVGETYCYRRVIDLGMSFYYNLKI